VDQGFAEEFSIGGVNQCVRGEDLGEGSRKRSSGGEEETAALEFAVLFVKAGLDGVDGLIGKIPSVGAGVRDDATGFGWGFLFRSVIGLTKFICEGFDKVRALAQKYVWGVVFEG
jgi:hypothetical protein